MTDDSDTTTEAAPVRVPNVSPGARSGLDHEVIGSNAQAAHDANEALARGEDPDDSPTTEGVTVPAGTLDERVAWVSGEGEDTTPEVRSARADAVWTHEQAAGDLDAEALEVLSGRLTVAVYGDPNLTPPVEVPEDLTTVDALLEWVHEVEGHDGQQDRAAAVLALEATRPEDDQRSTLIEPLVAEFPPPPQD